MKLRETWTGNEGDRVCIWCERHASLCVIEDPCMHRKQFEDMSQAEKDLLAVLAV